MDKTQTMQIKRQYPQYLRPAKIKGTYVCPLCGNGTGSDGDGLRIDPHGDGTQFKCFKCGFYGDIIDLYQQEHHCNFIDATIRLCELIDLTREKDCHKNSSPNSTSAERLFTSNDNSCKNDYNEYFKKCSEQLADTRAKEYLTFRGISLDTARAYGLGFDPSWKSPTAIRNRKNPPPTPRLIIPTSSKSYVAIDTRFQLTTQESKRSKIKEGANELFNIKVLEHNDGRPVFVTEGEMDALSLIEVGAQAISLGSANNVNKLLSKLKEQQIPVSLNIFLDNDGSGRKASKALAEGLYKLSIDFHDVAPQFYGNGKSQSVVDPNDLLKMNRELFTKKVLNTEALSSAHPDGVKYYFQRLFLRDIRLFKSWEKCNTGYENLDKELGGVYPGLYVIGAIPSLGKTTFLNQMADQMAAKGNHVLFFSLEQTRLEMISKSLSRITAQMDRKNAQTSLSIRTKGLSPEIVAAAQSYASSVGNHLSIIEKDGNCTAATIDEYVRRYMERNSVKPIVIVDYLQIMQSDTVHRYSAKEAVDINVGALKQISKSNGIPVFLISSLNRSNYLTPIDYESYKESGNIEYCADVMLGLQLSVFNDALFSKEGRLKEKRSMIRAAKAEIPRNIELICLKNKFGKSTFSVTYQYYPQYDLFIPSKKEGANSSNSKNRL